MQMPEPPGPLVDGPWGSLLERPPEGGLAPELARCDIVVRGTVCHDAAQQGVDVGQRRFRILPPNIPRREPPSFDSIGTFQNYVDLCHGRSRRGKSLNIGTV